MAEIELGPAWTWSEARQAGVTRRQIGLAGVRVSRGTYLAASSAGTLEDRCLAWLCCLPDRAVFAGPTAAALFGAPVAAGGPLHVALPAGSVLPRRRGLVAVERSLAPSDVASHRLLPVTAGPQTLLDLAARLPAAELVAVGDALLRDGHLSASSLDERLRRAGRARGVVRARACAPLLDDGAMSRPESLLRYWLVTSPLPVPQTQVAVRDRAGRVVAHGDLGYPEWRVLIEYEGRQHASGRQFDRDVDRYSLMGAGGWLLLRFARRHLDPDVVVGRTRSALLSRGWRPDPR